MFRKIRSGCLAVVLSAVALCDASAASYTVGPPTGLISDFSGGSSVISGNGTFSDTWSFHIGSVTDVSGSIFNTATTSSKFITNFAASFVAQGPSGVFTYAQFQPFAPQNPTVFQTLASSTIRFSPGDYAVSVTGKVAGGNPTYNLSLQVAAVPELESSVMFLAGLGLIGTIMRRRSRRESRV
jgi:hypothetical protein